MPVLSNSNYNTQSMSSENRFLCGINTTITQHPIKFHQATGICVVFNTRVAQHPPQFHQATGICVVFNTRVAQHPPVSPGNRFLCDTTSHSTSTPVLPSNRSFSNITTVTHPDHPFYHTTGLCVALIHHRLSIHPKSASTPRQQGQHPPQVSKISIHPTSVRSSSSPHQQGQLPPQVSKISIHPTSVRSSSIPHQQGQLPPQVSKTSIHPTSVRSSSIPHQQGQLPPQVNKVSIHPKSARSASTPSQQGQHPLQVSKVSIHPKSAWPHGPFFSLWV